jgi:hypothetical protein
MLVVTTARSSTSVEVARQLLARESAGGDDSETVVAGIQRTCRRVTANLCRSVGEDGCHALLTRAISRAQAEHPALRGILRAPDAGITVADVAATVDRHGAPAVLAAVEAMLVALVDILAGLIGSDMVLNILDNDGGPTRPPSGRQSQ